jgi:hypothetical protein
MKTKDFSDNEEVAKLLEAFEQRTISASDFSHAAHIAVAVSYLTDLPLDQALDRMRRNLQAFASHHHLENLYHETLTTFWMRLLAHLVTHSQPDLPLWERINRIVAEWGNRRAVRSHYSEELIASSAARENWLPPDRLPLPF